MSGDLLRGVVPVAPTVFTEDEELDLDGLRRVCDYLVDAGVSGICILANYSEQFSLTDEERQAVLQATLDQVAGRVAVCVTTSHYSARIAAQRSRQAAELGADMIMMMPPFFGGTMKVAEEALLGYFQTVADRLTIPIMLQDAPMSPTPLPVKVIGELATRIDLITHVKIETPQAAAKIAALDPVRRRCAWLVRRRGGDHPDSGPAGRRGGHHEQLLGRLGNWCRSLVSGRPVIGKPPRPVGSRCCHCCTTRIGNAASPRPRRCWPRVA